MWKDLPENEKEEYKRMILAFASLTELFSQKNEENDEIPAPIINSKYQETIFQKAFHASAEDIGNTSYDVAINGKNIGNRLKKYLIGIKTFGIGSGDQKVAQFKANLNEWSSIINQMQKNAKNEDGTLKKKSEIDLVNNDLYKELAVKISILRNERICSSRANLQGFKVKDEDEVESVYHVLMPSSKGQTPEIYVGETEYDLIDVANIEIIGCSSAKNPANFIFTDGKHEYKYTSADSQLYMKFNNKEIVLDTWDVKYAEDAYGLFSDIADKIYGIKKDTNVGRDNIRESYAWKIEVHRYSGFNGFFGVGSKMGTDAREGKINKVESKHKESVDEKLLSETKNMLQTYFLTKAINNDDRKQKERLRNSIIEIVRKGNNKEFEAEIRRLVYRPKNEMYIPIPKARKFHDIHPDFFGAGIGTFKENSKKLKLPKDQRKFNLIFEPSGDVLPAFIAQDDGKAIESVDKQTFLGEWILKGIFQLKDYEPLTEKRLEELGINGMRLYKTNTSEDIHLEFIWIDDENPPMDLI